MVTPCLFLTVHTKPGMKYQEHDPIERVRKLILAKEKAIVAELKNIEKEVKKEVDDVVVVAKVSVTLVLKGECNMEPRPSRSILAHQGGIDGCFLCSTIFWSSSRFLTEMV